MRSSLTHIFAGGEEQYINRILMDFLRTPGNHPAMDSWYKIAQGEPLTLLYDIWTEASKMQDQAYKYLDLVMEQYNVLVGTDVAGEVTGAELFYSDLTELCQAIDMWLQTGQTSQSQAALASASAEYYRSIGGMNPGALNVVRGWFELLQVIQDNKRITRCIASDCNKLLMILPPVGDSTYSDLLSGTIDGYHNKACQVAHTEGGQDTELQLQQLPGNEQLQETVGEITEGNPDGDVDTPEAL